MESSQAGKAPDFGSGIEGSNPSSPTIEIPETHKKIYGRQTQSNIDELSKSTKISFGWTVYLPETEEQNIEGIFVDTWKEVPEILRSSFTYWLNGDHKNKEPGWSVEATIMIPEWMDDLKEVDLPPYLGIVVDKKDDPAN